MNLIIHTMSQGLKISLALVGPRPAGGSRSYELWRGRGGQEGPGPAAPGPRGGGGSLDHLKVVKNGHDVLRHEDVAGVDGHAGEGDQQGV